MWALRQGGARVRTSIPGAGDRFPDVIPAVAGSRVVVVCDGSVACHDLRTGALLWRQRLWAGREVANPLIPGAATIADGRVFASFVHKTSTARSYHGTIPITEAIPTRRLVAFDLATGKRLWDHIDSPDPFFHEASIALPPVERQGVLYATAVLVQGALKSYVVAVDAATGQPRWRRFLGDGQVELTMFGNQAVEPLHMMPAEADGTVYVCTALGLVAALDAQTGEVRWVRRYPTLPLEAARSYYAVHREIPWRSAPPLIAGGVMVVAPLDAGGVFAFDCASGALRWRTERNDERRLLGIHDRRVAIQGSRIRLFDLGSGKLTAIVPSGARGRLTEPELGQGRIAGDEALIPVRGAIHRFDLRRGEALEPYFLGDGEGGEPGGSLVYVRGRVVLANPGRLSIFGVEAGY
jgi:outer membrane protein assembly factor BamB